MLPCLTEHWGNPSSAYSLAAEPARLIEEARERVARLIGANSRNIVFTSCGTESNNAALQGATLANPAKRHVVTTAVEHSANIKFCRQLEKRGYEVTHLPVDLDGAIDLCDLQAAIRPDTAIVSIMWANNETGVLFPIEEIAAICRSQACCFTRTQAAGKVHRRSGIGCRFPSLRTQAACAEGHRRALRENWCAVPTIHRGWRTGTRPTGRNGKRGKHCRLRQGC